MPVDFYGHTGDTANLCFTDGHAEKKSESEYLVQDFNLD